MVVVVGVIIMLEIVLNAGEAERLNIKKSKNQSGLNFAGSQRFLLVYMASSTDVFRSSMALWRRVLKTAAGAGITWRSC